MRSNRCHPGPTCLRLEVARRDHGGQNYPQCHHKSGGFTGEKKLESITSLAEKLTGETIEGLMITREVLIGFLDYCLENQIPREERVRLFIENAKNKGFNDLKQFV